YTKRLETRRYRTRGLNRLLIEACLLSTLVIKALRTDGHKVVVGFAVLRFQEPTQRLETGRHHAIVRTGGAHDQQCLGESRVAVSNDIFEPFPIRTTDRFIHLQQSPAEQGSHFLRVAVSGIGIEVLLNSKQGIGRGTGTVDFDGCGKRKLKKAPSSTSQCLIIGSTENRTEAPQRAAMAVFRANCFVPTAIVAEKVSESAVR